MLAFFLYFLFSLSTLHPPDGSLMRLWGVPSSRLGARPSHWRVLLCSRCMFSAGSAVWPPRTVSVALEGFTPLQFLFTTFGLLWVLWALALPSAKVLLGASFVLELADSSLGINGCNLRDIVLYVLRLAAIPILTGNADGSSDHSLWPLRMYL